jgi:hypothetical protein
VYRSVVALRVSNVTGMTLAHGNPTQDMHELLLRLLGAFSHLQICIDEMVARAFFSLNPPTALVFDWVSE